MIIGKKSQISIIMVFIATALFIIVAAFYLTGSMSERHGKEAMQQTQELPLEVQSVKSYIQSCLDKTAADALRLIGHQGGYIYQSQGGLTPDFSNEMLGVEYLTYGEDIKYNVPYLIKRPLGHIGNPPFYFSEIPDYPWKTFPYHSLPPTNRVFYGYFGLTYLPPIMRPFEGSIEEQLETFVANNMAKCVDWSTFSSEGLVIDSGDVLPNVTMLVNEIKFSIKFPITVTNKRTGATTTISDFTTSVPVKLLGYRETSIYDFIKLIMSYDVSDISYNIENAVSGPIRVIVKRDVYKNDDLIIVRDTSSKIRGEAFEFWFARQNRNPALYYIEENFQPFHLGDMYNNSIAVNGVDPDEDELTFRFEPSVVKEADLPPLVNQTKSLKIKVTASDGELEDYQELTVQTERLI